MLHLQLQAEKEYLEEITAKRKPILDSIRTMFIKNGWSNIEVEGHTGAIHILMSTKDMVAGSGLSVNVVDSEFKNGEITPQTRDLCLNNYKVITNMYDTFYLDDLDFEKISFYFRFSDGGTRRIKDFDFFY